MKGKYANAAERRRHLEELEKRAERAEHKAASLERELGQLREKTDRHVTGLQSELAAVKAQRDANTAPVVSDLEEQIRKLRQEKKDAQEYAQDQNDRYHQAFLAYRRILRMLGFTLLEANEIVFRTIVKDINPELILTDENFGINSKRAKTLPPDAAAVIQAARGHRPNMRSGIQERLTAALIKSLASEDGEEAKGGDA